MFVNCPTPWPYRQHRHCPCCGNCCHGGCSIVAPAPIYVHVPVVVVHDDYQQAISKLAGKGSR